MLTRLEYEVPEKFPSNRNWEPLDFVPLREQTKFHRAFGRTPYKFAFQLISNMAQRENKKATFKVASDVIGCIVASNVSARLRIPITPWILAHRFAHALQVEFMRSDEYREIDRAIKRLIEYSFRSGEPHPDLRGDWCQSVNIPENRFEGGNPPRNYENWPNHKSMPFELVASQYLTMRSARRQELTTDLEPFAEMVTQFIINGKVTLRAPAGGPVELIEKDFVDKAWEVEVYPREPFSDCGPKRVVTTLEPELFVDNHESVYKKRKLPPQHKVYTVLADPLPDGMMQECEDLINQRIDQMISGIQGRVVAF